MAKSETANLYQTLLATINAALSAQRETERTPSQDVLDANKEFITALVDEFENLVWIKAFEAGTRRGREDAKNFLLMKAGTLFTQGQDERAKILRDITKDM